MLACGRHNVSAAELLAAANVPRDITDASRIPAESVFALWREAEKRTGSEAIALEAAEQLPVGAYRVYDFLMMASSTVGDCFRRMVAYYPLVNEALRFRVQMNNKGAQVELHSPAGSARIPRPYVEFIFSLVLRRLRHMTGQEPPLREVDFAFAAPANIGPYHRRFAAPVRFGQTTNQIVFAREVLRLHLLQGDTELAEVLEEHAQRLMHRVPGEDQFPVAVRAAVEDALTSGAAELSSVSRALGMSPRSLQRRLAENGLTYREVFDEVQWERCRKLLAERGMPLQEVSFALGFSEPSAFHRAFRRWSGMTPQEYLH
ncbi:MAG: AraC family transcriptional regulator [Candidatus Acidiferrales bacterium]